MVDYEKGTAAWDIGMVLTRHAAGHRDGELVCARVDSLRKTALNGVPADRRLQMALNIKCDCGAGDSGAERSSIIKKEKPANVGRADANAHGAAASAP
jgi:hypothetical protein